MNINLKERKEIAKKAMEFVQNRAWANFGFDPMKLSAGCNAAEIIDHLVDEFKLYTAAERAVIEEGNIVIFNDGETSYIEWNAPLDSELIDIVYTMSYHDKHAETKNSVIVNYVVEHDHYTEEVQKKILY